MTPTELLDAIDVRQDPERPGWLIFSLNLLAHTDVATTDPDPPIHAIRKRVAPQLLNQLERAIDQARDAFDPPDAPSPAFRPDIVAILSDAMAKLPEVSWDRTAGDATARVVFGWLSPHPLSGSRDFVTLEAFAWAPGWVGVTTSSARYSAEFHARIAGPDDGNHQPCQPVDAVFRD